MKIRSFFFVLAAFALIAVSCSEQPSTIINTTDILDTRGVQEDKPQSHISGTWKSGNTWVNLKIDGNFEASFDGGSTVTGKWSISSDEKELKLVEETSNEGKGQYFKKTFTVIELSDAVMRVQDADGKQLELKAE